MLASIAFAAVFLIGAAPSADEVVPAAPAPVVLVPAKPANDALTAPPQHGGKTVSVAIVGTTGVSTTATAARGGDLDSHVGSLSLRSRRVGYAYDRGLLVRVDNDLELGGNDRGFHGGASVEASGGYRFHVSDTQGPFVRAGVDAVLRGDALVYQSLLELPQAHAGYQYLAGDTLLEVAGRAGASLFGRSNTGEHATRSVDQTLDVGAMATARTGPLLVLAGWSHFLARGRGGAVEWLHFGLCGASTRVAVCTDVRVVAGDVHFGAGATAEASVTEAGITAGFAGK